MITILEPGYEGMGEQYRLAKNDANYTECIITNQYCYGKVA